MKTGRVCKRNSVRFVKMRLLKEIQIGRKRERR